MLNYYSNKKNPHPKGFEGVIVNVCIGGKNKIVKYSYDDYSPYKARELALEKERQLLKRQKAAAENNVFSKNSNTGIKGLRLRYIKMKSKGGERLHKRLVFTGALREEWKGKTKSWPVPEQHGFTDDDWFDICNHIRNARNLKNATFEKLLKKQLTQRKITRAYNKLDGDLK